MLVHTRRTLHSFYELGWPQMEIDTFYCKDLSLGWWLGPTFARCLDRGLEQREEAALSLIAGGFAMLCRRRC
jgi:hypothetical protein